MSSAVDLDVFDAQGWSVSPLCPGHSAILPIRRSEAITGRMRSLLVVAVAAFRCCTSALDALPAAVAIAWPRSPTCRPGTSRF